MFALICDFLRSAQRIIVLLVPNGRSLRYLHLGMWFASFGLSLQVIWVEMGFFCLFLFRHAVLVRYAEPTPGCTLES